MNFKTAGRDTWGEMRVGGRRGREGDDGWEGGGLGVGGCGGLRHEARGIR